MQARLEALTEDDKTEPGASSGEAFSKPKAAAAKTRPDPSNRSDAAKDAALRRVCERKPSGKLKVPESIHLKWKNGSRAERNELLQALEESEWDQDHGWFISIPFARYWILFSHKKISWGWDWMSLFRKSLLLKWSAGWLRPTSWPRKRNVVGTQRSLWPVFWIGPSSFYQD